MKTPLLLLAVSLFSPSITLAVNTEGRPESTEIIDRTKGEGQSQYRRAVVDLSETSSNLVYLGRKYHRIFVNCQAARSPKVAERFQKISQRLQSYEDPLLDFPKESELDGNQDLKQNILEVDIHAGAQDVQLKNILVKQQRIQGAAITLQSKYLSLQALAREQLQIVQNQNFDKCQLQHEGPPARYGNPAKEKAEANQFKMNEVQYYMVESLLEFTGSIDSLARALSHKNAILETMKTRILRTPR